MIRPTPSASPPDHRRLGATDAGISRKESCHETHRDRLFHLAIRPSRDRGSREIDHLHPSPGPGAHLRRTEEARRLAADFRVAFLSELLRCESQFCWQLLSMQSN